MPFYLCHNAVDICTNRAGNAFRVRGATPGRGAPFPCRDTSEDLESTDCGLIQGYGLSTGLRTGPDYQPDAPLRQGARGGAFSSFTRAKRVSPSAALSDSTPTLACQACHYSVGCDTASRQSARFCLQEEHIALQSMADGNLYDLTGLDVMDAYMLAQKTIHWY